MAKKPIVPPGEKESSWKSYQYSKRGMTHICPMCGEGFYKDELYKEHYKAVHRKKRMSLICYHCLTSRTGDKIGDRCKTEGCRGTIERAKEYHELVTPLPGPMTCGRRMDMYPGGILVHPEGSKGIDRDRWEQFKLIDNRVCSYCGSLHPDDFFRLVREAALAPEDGDYRSHVSIEPSDKGYKIYVNQPGVRNAHEGGIKFYKQHLPKDAQGNLLVTEEQNLQYKEAVRRSNVRFNRMMSMIRAKMNDSDSNPQPEVIQ